MHELFKHIENNTFTLADLEQFLAEGGNINEGAQEGVSTLLTQACQAENLDCIQMLLDHGANMHAMDEDCRSSLAIAYWNENLSLLLLLLKFEQKEQAAIRKKVELNPEKYSDQEKEDYLNRWFNNDTHEDVEHQIKELVLSDKELSQFPQVIALVNSVKVIDSAADFSGGNADDKIEAIILELGTEIRFHFEFYFADNWSYGETHWVLTCRENDNLIIDYRKHEGENDTYEEASLQEFSAVCKLATKLQVDDLTPEQFYRLLLILLSRRVQTKRIKTLLNHGFYYVVNTEEGNSDLDPFIRKHFSKTPIKELIFDNQE